MIEKSQTLALTQTDYFSKLFGAVLLLSTSLLALPTQAAPELEKPEDNPLDFGKYGKLSVDLSYRYENVDEDDVPRSTSKCFDFAHAPGLFDAKILRFPGIRRIRGQSRHR